ncbi:MAG: VOC family protein [Bacteroidia bacterium]|nr:VOC family protein [Bacteroidia bacterium]
MYSHAATIIPVNDIRDSIDFYVGKLGFQCTFEWEEPATYAVLNFNDKINIHLSKMDEPVQLRDQTIIYIFVHDVDSVYKSLITMQVAIQNPPKTWDYGMRDFDILDNTGHRLSFGMGV